MFEFGLFIRCLLEWPRRVCRAIWSVTRSIYRFDEDDNLASWVSGDFDSATPGDLMVLNVTGYPTLDGVGNDPGGSATLVAVFVRKTGNTIVYRTI